MPSTQTFFRLSVMVGVGVVAVKGWHLYGPTNEQVKNGSHASVEVVRQGAIEVAERQIDGGFTAGSTIDDRRERYESIRR